MKLFGGGLNFQIFQITAIGRGERRRQQKPGPGATWNSCRIVPSNSGGNSDPKKVIMPTVNPNAEGDAEVAQRQAEGQVANAPTYAKQECQGQTLPRGLLINVQQVGNRDQCHDQRTENPKLDTTHQPIRLPAPFAHLLERNIEAGGGEAAQRVKQDAEGASLNAFSSASPVSIPSAAPQPAAVAIPTSTGWSPATTVRIGATPSRSMANTARSGAGFVLN